MHTKRAISCCLAFLLATLVSFPAIAAAAASTFTVTPESVSVGLFYGGTRVRVEGFLPVGDEAAIVCVGDETSLNLKKIGKVWGLLWMTVGKVKFDRISEFYNLATSTDIKRLAAPPVLEKLGIGYQALMDNSLKEKKDPENRRLFGEMIKLKEHEGIFNIGEKKVVIAPGDGAVSKVSADLRIPPNTPMGDYTIKVFSFRNGQGSLVFSKAITVRQVGLVALVGSLAMKYGMLYGIVSVFIALFAGLLTGFLFGLGSKGGH